MIEHSQTRWMYPVTGYGSQDDYELHFGLGAVSKIDSLQLAWPNDQTDVYKFIEINKHYLAVEGGEFGGHQLTFLRLRIFNLEDWFFFGQFPG